MFTSGLEPVCFGRYRDTRNVSLYSKIKRKLCKFKHLFHFGRYYQLSIELKPKLDGNSIANFLNKSTIFPHKITYLTCHSSAIYTCKVTCLPCMLFTCLFLLPHVNYALNYILVQVVDKSYFEMAPPKLYSTLHAEMRYLLPVSHRSSFGGYGHKKQSLII